MRVKAVIAYDGSAYAGFQRQTHTSNTVTSAIETALKALKIDSKITGSGRTDAGVHATGQVIHFDIPLYWGDLQKLQLNLNRKLHDIRIKHITAVSDEFHARFSAKKRLYRYIFKTSQPSVFEQKYISYYQDFDEIRLKEALKYFEGRHDFVFFHKTGSDIKTTIREIYKTNYKQIGNYHIIYFLANGFLRSQVRMMVDFVMLYAQGKLQHIQLEEQLSGQTKHSSKLAPGEGLYLARIFY